MNITAITGPDRHWRTTATEPLRLRAELPAVIAAKRPAPIAAPVHDFLVPNPRPDLTAERRPHVN